MFEVATVNAYSRNVIATVESAQAALDYLAARGTLVDFEVEGDHATAAVAITPLQLEIFSIDRV